MAVILRLATTYMLFQKMSGQLVGGIELDGAVGPFALMELRRCELLLRLWYRRYCSENNQYKEYKSSGLLTRKRVWHIRR